MKAQAYKIQRFEARSGWNAGWETKMDYTYCLTLVKKAAEKMSKADPIGTYRIMGQDGRCYWEVN